MSVTKIDGFASPYRSQFFQAIVEAQLQGNGVLSMSGSVETSGDNAIIPPFTINQQGLMFESDSDISTTIPALVAPYYLIVSANSPTQTNDLVFTFVKSPADVPSNATILSMWDGLSWLSPSLISNTGLLESQQVQNVAFQNTKALNGLITTQVSSNYNTSAGQVCDPDGTVQVANGVFVAPVIAADSDFSRIDRIVYRKDADVPGRIGQREFVLGSTYTASTATAHSTQIAASTSVNQGSVVAIDPADNSAQIFYVSGYGNLFNLQYQKWNSGRTSQVGSTINLSTVSSGFGTLSTPNFTVVIDASQNIHIACIVNGKLTYAKINNVGAFTVNPTVVDNRATPSDFPKISIDPLQLQVFFVYQNQISAGLSQIFQASYSLGGLVISLPQQITSGTANFIHPSFAVTDDLLLTIAYEDSLTAKIWYQVTNSTAAQQVAPTLISGATFYITTAGTIVNQASYPKVRIADNRQVFILFMQVKPDTDTGIAVYTNGSATMQDLTASNENVTAYSVQLDSEFNDLNITTATASGTNITKLTTSFAVFSIATLNATIASSISTAKDNFGSLFSVYSLAFPGTFTNTGSTEAIKDFGPAAIGGSLNTVVLSSNEFLIASSLSYIPKVGDRVTITDSVVNYGGNNVTTIVTGVTEASNNTTNDTFIVQVTATFTSELTSPALAQYANPNGNTVRFIKSVGEVNETRAASFATLPTDILLARMTASTILNYIPLSGAGVNSDNYGIAGQPTLGWTYSSPTGSLVLSSGLNIYDLINNIVWAAAAGTYSLNDGQALYLLLDPTALTPTPQIADIELIPWGEAILVLGFSYGGMFNPHVLSRAGMNELENGETIILGDDMSTTLQARLGIVTDTTFTPYANNNFISSGQSYPTAISALDARALTQQLIVEQNQTMKLTNGGTWAYNSGTKVLSWSANANISIPGLADTVNVITAGSVTFTAVGQVAYVTVNRSGSGGTIAPAVVAEASYVQADNKIVFAMLDASGNINAGVNNSTLAAQTALQTTASNSGHLILTGVNVQTQLDETDTALTAYINYYVTTEAQLTTALAAAVTAGGGVICISASFTITSSHTIPTGTRVIGRGGLAIITFGNITASITLSDGVKVSDVYFLSAQASGTLITASNNYSTMRDCNFSLVTSNSCIGINISGNANKFYNNVFSGVAASLTSIGIEYSAGIDNADNDSVFLP